MFKRKFLLLATIVMAALSVKAQTYSVKWSADRGNGTYANPIVNGDFPDCDVIRVGDTFYFVSTTMYHFPGATLLKSKDLVNWEYCANPLLKIDNTNGYNLLANNWYYSKGMWAASLNYHDGKFYIYFISYGCGGEQGRNVLLTATDPEGEWKMQYMDEHYYDAGWLFDDGEQGDGYLYVACGIGNLYINKLNAKTLKKISSTQVVANKDGYEGSHLYHIGDYYYLYVTTGGYWKGQTIYRATNPMGPYEEVPYTLFQGDAIHQGALVDTPTGEWWTVLFKDAGAIGRIPCLEPVTWKDGWPIVGNNGRDVCQNGKTYRKPKISDDEAVQNADYRTYLPTNDAFSTPTLGMQWQWNHLPQATAWSLTQRPGWMRLYSCTVTDNVAKARGSLTQRIMGYTAASASSSAWKNCYGTVKMDISAMKEGDVAGLAVWQNPYSFIGVKMQDGKKYLYSQLCRFNDQKITLSEEKTGVEITDDVIYLRAITNFGTNKCSYTYSTNGTNWKSFGLSMTMGYGLEFFVGQRYYLFNYSTVETGGYIDIDWFTTETTMPVDAFAQMDADALPLHQSSPEVAWYGFPFENGKLNMELTGVNTLGGTSEKPSFDMVANGVAGWVYPTAFDMSEAKNLVVKLRRSPGQKFYINIYDKGSIWSKPYTQQIKTDSTVIDLHNMVTEDGVKIDPSTVGVVTFSTVAAQKVYFSRVYLSTEDGTPVGVDNIECEGTRTDEAYYDLTGRRVNSPVKGIYIKGGKKVVRK